MNLSKIEVLTALNLPRVGRKTVLKAVDRLRHAPDEVNPSDLLHAVAALVAFDDCAERAARESAVRQLEEAEELGISVVTVLDEDYPFRLRTIEDKPALLYVRGSITCCDKQLSIAIIGTRDPSPFAQKAARSSARLAAEKGALVVSGLAKGCDTLAHMGCLDVRGQTVAVMAHGLDRVYPQENRRLASQIVDEGGALVSEYSVGAPAQRSSFVERDRLQSALSDGVLVIETSETGGTMHTVRFAHSQGRPLATVCHPLAYDGDDRVGGNRLVRERFGGVSIRDKESLEEFISGATGGIKPANVENDPAIVAEGEVTGARFSVGPLQGSLFGDDYAS